MERTARLGLPTLVAGQAGKEITHNEALVLMDLLVGGVADEVGRNEPPVSPGVGRCWIVGAVPTGAWAGRPDALACWTEGGWRFVDPAEGLTVALRSTGVPVRYHDGAWRVGEVAAERLIVGGEGVVGARCPPIPDPSSGAAVDVEARAALVAVLSALRAHGLIAT